MGYWRVGGSGFMILGDDDIVCPQCGHVESLPFDVGDDCYCGGQYEEVTDDAYEGKGT